MRILLTSSLIALATCGAAASNWPASAFAQEPVATPPPPATVVRSVGPIAWGKSLDAARRSAQPSQVIVVDVTAEWCSWCRYMDTRVFPDQAVCEFASSHLFVKLDPKDGAEGQAFARKLKVKAYPALFVFGPDGKLLRKQIGAFDGPSDFLAWLRGAMPAR